MEIVLNKCYGGFGLSSIAQQEYAKLKGFKLFFYKQTKYKHSDKVNEYKRIKDNDANKGMFIMSLKKNLGAVTNKIPNNNSYFSAYEIERVDKDLIKVVKKLKEKANGLHSDLNIVEIPDNTEYQIEEYDGKEWIAERHQTWS